MAAHTLSPHDRGVAVDEHRRARGRIFARRETADLSRGRAGRLHLDRRAHPGRKNSDRAAIPAGARGVLLGAAGGPARSRRKSGRRVSPRTARRNRTDRAQNPSPGRKLAVHRTPGQPHSQLLRRSRRPHQGIQAGSGHDREAGIARRGRPPDHQRRFRSPSSISAPCCSRSCAAFWRCRARA